MIKISKLLVTVVVIGIYTLCFHVTNSYKILLVSPQFVSHVYKNALVGSALLKAGHEVHMVLESRFDENLVEKFREKGFQLHFFREPDHFLSFSAEEFKKFLGNEIFNVTIEYVKQIKHFIKAFDEECGYMMGDREFLEELRKMKFDLVVVEPFILHMCCLILPKYLNLPFVSISFNYNPLKIRSPALPSFSPRHWFSRDVHRNASFFMRFCLLLGNIYLSTSLSPINTDLTLLNKHLPGVASYEDLVRESLLFLYEVDHHFNNFLPLFPNHVSIAGLTCSPAKQLPDDILNFINGRMVDGRDPGLILMTFGSTADYMLRSIVRKFLKAFASLNETILAKFTIDPNDSELISLIPPNLLILEGWLPQNDVLGLPSTKLFITHCGNNGQHEALYHGVPMLGFPLFAEQDENARKIIALDYGLTMDISTFTETELVENIREVIDNRKYKTTIQRVSKAFRDQPMTAQQKVVSWIEHVIKHGGVHLRPSAMDLPMFQFLCFDTVAILVLSIIGIAFILIKLSIFSLREVFNYYNNKLDIEKVKNY